MHPTSSLYQIPGICHIFPQIILNMQHFLYHFIIVIVRQKEMLPLNFHSYLQQLDDD